MRALTTLATILLTMNVSVTNAGIYVTGSISNDTSWTSGVYVLDGTVSVATGATLTISPGVTVLTKDFASNLLVAGNLIAEGTETQRITFSSLNQALPGDYSSWNAIRLSDSNGSKMEYVTIESSWFGLSLDGTSTLTIKNNIFLKNLVAISDQGGYQPMDVQHNLFVENYSAFAGIRTLNDSHFNYNVFKDNTNVFEYGYYFGNVDVSLNNFINNELVMKAPAVGYGYGTVSMLNNWWGTTDIAAVEDMIYDRKDLGILQHIGYSIEGQPIETAGLIITSTVPTPPTASLLGLGLIILIGTVIKRKAGVRWWAHATRVAWASQS